MTPIELPKQPVGKNPSKLRTAALALQQRVEDLELELDTLRKSFSSSAPLKYNQATSTPNLKALPSGCGLGFFSGITGGFFSPRETIVENGRLKQVEKDWDKMKTEFEKVKTTVAANNWGAILCSLGQPYYTTSEVSLLKLGFEILAEYQNPNYVKGRTQRVYIYYMPGCKAELKKEN